MDETPPTSFELSLKLERIYIAIHQLDETLARIEIPSHLTTNTADTLDNIAGTIQDLLAHTYWSPRDFITGNKVCPNTGIHKNTLCTVVRVSRSKVYLQSYRTDLPPFTQLRHELYIVRNQT